jgi:glucosyl-dolichyl phosphate glucuronosyltransferase
MRMSNVQLTVLLASRNRAGVLARVLDGYCRVAPPPVGWKMVLVDNGSTDATPTVIESFKRVLPLEALSESMPGKNRALNRGLVALEGRLVIVTDDDAIPSPSFLSAWAKYLERETRYGLFGGSIAPRFDVPPPKWLIDSRLGFAMMFAERDLAEGPIEADAIYGPNMAVRKPIFDDGFRFDERVGPNALDPCYPMGGETEFCWRVAQSGVQCWYSREPLVTHIVAVEQMRLAAWERRAYRTGRGRAHQMWERGEIVAPPAPSLRQRLTMFSPFAKPRFESRCAYQLWRGFEDECLRRMGGTSLKTVAGEADLSRGASGSPTGT